MTITSASENRTGEQATAVLDDTIVHTPADANRLAATGGAPFAAGSAAPGGGVPGASSAAAPGIRPAADDRGRTFAITSFVLGIVSVVSGWTFVAPIIGLVFGVLALRRNTSERALALWGVWTSAAMLAISVIAVAVGAMFLGFGLLAAPYVG